MPLKKWVYREAQHTRAYGAGGSALSERATGPLRKDYLHLALELGFEGRVQVHQALLTMGKESPDVKDSKYTARVAGLGQNGEGEQK